MKKIAIGLIVVLAIVLGLVLFLRSNEDTWICSNGQWIKHGNPSSPKPTTACKANPSQTPTPSPNANIKLTNLKSGDTISMPFVIKGEARVFENQLNFRVRDAKGRVIIEGTMLAQAKQAGQYGPFNVTINSVPSGKATIEVFDYSAKDSSEIDKVSIQVSVK